MSEPSGLDFNEAKRKLREYAQQLDVVIKATRDGGSVAMAESDSDGEPAFPQDNHYGMSLRDWFAGMALQGLLASDSETQSMKFDEAAELAYDHADAMLKARVTVKPTP